MPDDNLQKKKRPGWVWAISIFYFLFAGGILFFLYLIGTGAVPLNAAQETFFSSLTGLEYGLTILMGLANLFGAVALFLLRKFAFNLFVTALGANLLLTALYAETEGLVAAIGGPSLAGLVGSLIAWALIIAVCIYSWKLIQRGVLT